MPGLASFNKKVSVKTTAEGSSLYSELPGTSISLHLAGDLLDDTVYGSSIRSRTFGLRDWSMSGTVLFAQGNTAINKVRNAWLNRTRLNILYLPNGTDGFTGRGVVESIEFSGEVGGLEQCSITIQSNGTLTTI
jgi:hypothetical protein